VEKLFYVKSGADPESIRVKLSGGKLNVNENGELEVKTELGTVKFSKPLAYQEVEGKREFVEAGYVVRGDEYSFKVGDYDKEKELVIDPVLAATFLGGSSDDLAFAITLDSTDNVYVSGETTSSDFPGVGSGSADKTFGGVEEAFVAELDPNLSAHGAPTPTPTARPTGSPKPTASPTPSPTKISSPGNCSIGGPVDIGTGIANVLMPLLPLFAIGLRAIRRRAKK